MLVLLYSSSWKGTFGMDTSIPYIMSVQNGHDRMDEHAFFFTTQGRLSQRNLRETPPKPGKPTANVQIQQLLPTDTV